LKVLRGSALDVFGKTEERRQERALIDAYRTAIEGMLPTLSAANRDAAAAFARVPEQIRGYGHVKARHLAVARSQWDLLLAQFHAHRAQAA
jgi:indolepyruvate ferredoxin oxidoreductase